MCGNEKMVLYLWEGNLESCMIRWQSFCRALSYYHRQMANVRTGAQTK